MASTTSSHENHSFDLKNVIRWISENKYTHIVLETTDQYLFLLPQLLVDLQHTLDHCCFFLSADLNYGSSTTDEVSVDHLSSTTSTCIIHIGYTSFTSPVKYPVYYIFETIPPPSESLIKRMRNSIISKQGSTAITYDLEYHQWIPSLVHSFQDIPSVEFAHIIIPNPQLQYLSLEKSLYQKPSSFQVGTGRFVNRPFDNLFIIGEHESPMNRHLQLCYFTKNITCFNPSTPISLEQNILTTRFFSSRLMMLDKIRSSQFIAVLLSTCSIPHIQEILLFVRKVIAQSGKQSLVLCIRKINVTKLCNFPSFDLFCHIAPPEDVIFDREKEHFKPIVTFWELLSALLPESIIEFSDYQSDLVKLYKSLSENPKVIKWFESETDSISDSHSIPTVTTLTEIEKETRIISTHAIDRLKKLNWTGLNPHLKVSTLDMQKGQKGIASKYLNEGDITSQKSKSFETNESIANFGNDFEPIDSLSTSSKDSPSKRILQPVEAESDSSDDDLFPSLSIQSVSQKTPGDQIIDF